MQQKETREIQWRVAGEIQWNKVNEIPTIFMSVQILAKLKQLSVQAGEADQSRCRGGGISGLTPDIVSHKVPLNSIWSIVSDCKIYPRFVGYSRQIFL